MGTVVDGSELIEPLGCPGDALEELHVHLQAVTRLVQVCEPPRELGMT